MTGREEEGGGFFRYDGRLKSETNAFGEDGNAFEIFFLTQELLGGAPRGVGGILSY